MKSIIIVGGSYSAVVALNAVLALKQKVTVTIIAPSEFTWNNTAAPRLLIELERKNETLVNLKELVEKKIAASIHEGAFIKSVVTAADLDEKTIIYNNETISYDYLILATGSRYESNAFKLSATEDHTSTLIAIDDLVSKINAAKSIAIIGAGPTGVETAGELGYNYGKEKKIDLYTGSSAPLPSLRDSTRKSAISRLKNLDINVINDVLIDNYTDTSLSHSGSTKNYDLVIPTFKSYPNTEFLSENVLNKNKYVNVDENFILENYSNVLAFGDVASTTPKSLADILYFQSKSVNASVKNWFGELNLVKYSNKSMMVVPILRNGGVGELFGWSFPSFLIKQFKGKDFGIKSSKGFFS